MDTIKTAFVVALLLAVLYGVYVVLNKEPASNSPEVANMLQEAEEEGIFDGLEVDDGQVTEQLEPPSEELKFEEVPEVSQTDVAADPLAHTDPDTADVNPPRSEHFPPETQLPGPEAEGTQQGSLADQDSLPEQGSLPEQDGAADQFGTREAPQAPDNSYDVGNTGPGSYDNQGTRHVPAPDESTEIAQEDLDVSSENPGGSSVYSPSPSSSTSFDELWKKAQAEIAAQKYAEALATATSAYRSQLDDQQRDQLQDLLDPLAAKVIYSREPWLEPTYTARGDETLADIAATYFVPAQLLQNINGLDSSDRLMAGTALKVVKGPFRAEVDIPKGELTLYLQEMYAGRFVITVGSEPAPQPGTYWVKTKEEGHTYFASGNRTIEASDPSNPYGDVWIDLGRDNVCIHGSALKGVSAPGAGCISLSPAEARDVYGILVEGSKVDILP